MRTVLALILSLCVLMPCVNADEPTMNGISEQYYTDGSLYAQIKYLKGEAQWSRIYYSRGKLKAEHTYKNNMPHGVQKLYYENGQLESEGRFVSGEPDGITKTYFNDGVLKSTTQYKRGRRHGPSKTFFSNGSIELDRKFKDDVLDGVQKEFHQNGKLRSKKKMKKGHVVSDRKAKSKRALAPAPAPARSRNVMAIRASDLEKESYDSEVVVSSPIENGTLKTYHKNGRLRLKVKMVDGKREGKYRSYYPNGQLEHFCRYLFSKKDGEAKTFHESGELKYLDKYKMGIRVHRKSFDEKGEIIYEEFS